MIHDVGNIEFFELLETEPQDAVHSMPIILERRHRLLHMRAFLAERNRCQSNFFFLKYTMDLLSLPEYVIKKGRPHGHRYGKKPGDK